MQRGRKGRSITSGGRTTRTAPSTNTRPGRLFIARSRIQQRPENIHTRSVAAKGNSPFLNLFFFRQLPEAQGSIASHRLSSGRCPTAHRPPENPPGDPGRLLYPRQTPPSQPTNRKDQQVPARPDNMGRQTFLKHFVKDANLMISSTKSPELLCSWQPRTPRTVVLLLRLYFWPRGRRGSRKRGVGFAAPDDYPQPLIASGNNRIEKGKREAKKASGLGEGLCAGSGPMA
ncbi:hypothetical protein F5144DRAFT_79345 [Chaetomium tenue]|uniref:Uncharacterized protein n=1 Tax=Chaetomium tenue TaxID=1854479 RepID=A0ACB7PS10_9PEZI|nr:hypothetical protein F5144DRAFT_79345 [Chaetomium globosum]